MEFGPLTDVEKPIESYSLAFTCQVIDFTLELVKEEQEKIPVIREILGDILTDPSLRQDYCPITGIVYKNSMMEGKFMHRKSNSQATLWR